MAEHPSVDGAAVDVPLAGEVVPVIGRRDPIGERLAKFPWWLVALFLIAIWAGFLIYTRENFRDALNFIRQGAMVTLITTVAAYSIALILGLIAGLGRISRNVFFNNLATLYVEIIRGIPILVLIFYIAYVGVPTVVDGLNAFGFWLDEQGMSGLGTVFTAFENSNVSLHLRAVIALAVTYGAFLAEIFRAGIQSIGRGQMEAARSLGMSYGQSMRYVILPQAVRNVLPALGNDFVAMVKDSSLVSVLAVRDFTQLARLYAGSSFRYREAYTTLAVLYLTITILLSLGVRGLERMMRSDE